MKKITNDKELFDFLSEDISTHYNLKKRGNSHQINSTIAFFLNQKGFNVKILDGCVLLDHPFVLNIDEPFNGIFDPVHVWIELDGKILDFASAQFKEHLENFNSEPYFNGSSEHYAHGEVISFDNEWVDKKLINKWNENSVLKEYKGHS